MEWLPISSAPRDGTPITVAVSGRDETGWPFHELPYKLRWGGGGYLGRGRWCYARNGAPVFEWQQPVKWRMMA